MVFICNYEDLWKVYLQYEKIGRRFVEGLFTLSTEIIRDLWL